MGDLSEILSRCLDVEPRNFLRVFKANIPRSPVRDSRMHPKCQHWQGTGQGLPGSGRQVNVDVGIHKDLAQVFRKDLSDSRHLVSYGLADEKREVVWGVGSRGGVLGRRGRQGRQGQKADRQTKVWMTDMEERWKIWTEVGYLSSDRSYETRRRCESSGVSESRTIITGPSITTPFPEFLISHFEARTGIRGGVCCNSHVISRDLRTDHPEMSGQSR